MRLGDLDEDELNERIARRERSERYLREHGWTSDGVFWRDPAPRYWRGQSAFCTLTRAAQRQRARDKCPFALDDVTDAPTERRSGNFSLFAATIDDRDRVVLAHVPSGRSFVIDRPEAAELARALAEMAEK